MSRHHIEKVTCPSCHHEGDFELWDSINTALDPEMKEKVLNQSIFLYTCPSCGETFRLNYSTLYHQIGNRHIKIINLVHFFSVDRNYSRIIFIIIRKYIQKGSLSSSISSNKSINTSTTTLFTTPKVKSIEKTSTDNTIKHI